MKLNSTIICRAALVLFAKYGLKGNFHGLGSIQRHVDVVYCDDDLDLPLDQFSGRFVRPMVDALTRSIPDGSQISSILLETPQGVDSASERYEGIAMRCALLRDFSYDSLEGRQANLRPHQHKIMRLDVTFEPA